MSLAFSRCTGLIGIPVIEGFHSRKAFIARYGCHVLHCGTSPEFALAGWNNGECDPSYTEIIKLGGFVDPSILNPFDLAPPMKMTESPSTGYPPQVYRDRSSQSPSHHASMSSLHSRQGSPTTLTIRVYQSPNMYPPQPYRAMYRSPPSSSRHSYVGQDRMVEQEMPRENGICPNPGCGRIFKDLKAHMLTHQEKRPEKCPIQTCGYHIKGFARKYDRNRHTLTHYKGTMVCGFCPRPGSSAEKSFNRADVFKQHLMTVHGVELTAPNCRKKGKGANSTKATSYSGSETAGKCSTCSATFRSAQDFYEHLDDCVLRQVQLEDPETRKQQQQEQSSVQTTVESEASVDTVVRKQVRSQAVKFYPSQCRKSAIPKPLIISSTNAPATFETRWSSRRFRQLLHHGMYYHWRNTASD